MMTDRAIAAYHFGPSTDYVGGMASVIGTLVDLGLGADVVRAVPTWRPGSHLGSSALAVSATMVVARLPASSVVHIHMSAGGSFLREAAILATANLRGITRVVTIHGHHFEKFSTRYPQLVASVLQMATAITVLSEPDRIAVQRLAPHVQVELMPNPMPLDLLAGRASETPEFVLFGGEVGTRKGADVLHRAWEAVSTSRPSATCLIVGPATELNLPNLERLEVRGPISADVMRELIRQARVVALPSRAEALPMMLSEAMAAGRPFVSTPIGGVSALAVGGILVPVDDERALASALIELLSNPRHAQALGTAGQVLCERWMAPAAVDACLRRLYSPSRSGQP